MKFNAKPKRLHARLHRSKQVFVKNFIPVFLNIPMNPSSKKKKNPKITNLMNTKKRNGLAIVIFHLLITLRNKPLSSTRNSPLASTNSLGLSSTLSTRQRLRRPGPHQARPPQHIPYSAQNPTRHEAIQTSSSPTSATISPTSPPSPIVFQQSQRCACSSSFPQTAPFFQSSHSLSSLPKLCAHSNNTKTWRLSLNT